MPVNAAIADSIQPVQTTCRSDVTIRQSAPLAESSAHIDPAVFQQPRAYRVSAFERTGPFKKIFRAVDVIVDPLDERGLQCVRDNDRACRSTFTVQPPNQGRIGVGVSLHSRGQILYGLRTSSVMPSRARAHADCGKRGAAHRWCRQGPRFRVLDQFERFRRRRCQRARGPRITAARAATMTSSGSGNRRIILASHLQGHARRHGRSLRTEEQFVARHHTPRFFVRAALLRSMSICRRQSSWSSSQ